MGSNTILLVNSFSAVGHLTMCFFRLQSMLLMTAVLTCSTNPKTNNNYEIVGPYSPRFQQDSLVVLLQDLNPSWKQVKQPSNAGSVTTIEDNGDWVRDLGKILQMNNITNVDIRHFAKGAQKLLHGSEEKVSVICDQKNTILIVSVCDIWFILTCVCLVCQDNSPRKCY